MSLSSFPTVFDASVLINLLATERAEEVIGALGVPGYVCPAVLDETLYIRAEHPADPFKEVRLAPILDAGILKRIALETDKEYQLYVSYSVMLDDGEAMTLAIADSRALAVATDDKKARRVAQREGSHITQVVSTPMLIRNWVNTERPAEKMVREAIKRIETTARYRPREVDPLRPWWDAHR